MNLKYDTSFVIMPGDCNAMFPMIFGGAFFSRMDLCAAVCVSRLLHDSECDSAVTHKFSGTFHVPTELGDIIFLYAEVKELRHKAIRVEVRAYREKRCRPERDFVAVAEFVFVSRKGGKYHPHGLTMPEEK